MTSRRARSDAAHRSAASDPSEPSMPTTIRSTLIFSTSTGAAGSVCADIWPLLTMGDRSRTAVAPSDQGQVADEPVAGELRHGLQSAGLGEQMGGSRDDGKLILAPQQGPGLPVELEDEFVVTADDEQGRGAHGRQFRGGQVGPAAAGDDGGDVGTGLGRGPQRGGGGRR
ncbi:hypothetical protein BL254_23890 [Protofrankia sp. BMG5.30]|uniref:Uncharacterized protein n=1 Tax=Protofrankia coriariae TaxID=1562887 RepID=A0ABR5EZQ7_9ACTN|nr:hypothetical protein FrCorBMG51_21455 [Protofrankia coriariae]ONH30735.1 hypothetical protein BL254_23890 [Protofrankia sp. BMG5.30]